MLGALLVVVLATGSAWLLLVVVLCLHRPSRELAGPAVRLVPDLVRLVRALVADDATPRSVKVALRALLLYLVSPIDLVPDFLPVIGSVDDLIVGGLVLRWAGRRIGVETLRSHWPGRMDGFELLHRLLGL
ncbi:MAG: DUF1232 domain-containing protein [Devosia sp.]|nr:DUF1232 domain-containing protein [Devosia sp.]